MVVFTCQTCLTNASNGYNLWHVNCTSIKLLFKSLHWWKWVKGLEVGERPGNRLNAPNPLVSLGRKSRPQLITKENPEWPQPGEKRAVVWQGRGRGTGGGRWGEGRGRGRGTGDGRWGGGQVVGGGQRGGDSWAHTLALGCRWGAGPVCFGQVGLHVSSFTSCPHRDPYLCPFSAPGRPSQAAEPRTLQYLGNCLSLARLAHMDVAGLAKSRQWGSVWGTAHPIPAPPRFLCILLLPTQPRLAPPPGLSHTPCTALVTFVVWGVSFLGRRLLPREASEPQRVTWNCVPRWQLVVLSPTDTSGPVCQTPWRPGLPCSLRPEGSPATLSTSTSEWFQVERAGSPAGISLTTLSY